MKRHSAFGLGHAAFSLVATMSLYGLGCAGESTDAVVLQEANLGQAEQYAGTGGDPGTHNHFRPQCFWDHAFQQTARDLAEDRIVDEDGTLPSMPYMSYLADPTCRKEALEILVGCALSEGRSAIDHEDDNRVYEGELGFDADWMEQPLSEKGRERVTACMIQRLNAFGIEMQILLYTLPEFPADANALTMYPVSESQAWGNLFDSTVDLNPTHDPNITSLPAFDAYVCRDVGLYDCEVTGTIYTYGRICDNANPTCGLTALEQCGNQCPHADPVLCSMWGRRMSSNTPDDSFCDSH